MLNQTEQDYAAARRRLLYAAGVFLTMVTVSTLGYHLIGVAQGRPDWTLEDCLYMTVITVSTVGYTEALPVREVPWALEWTLVVVTVGIGVNLWTISSLTSFFLEGDFSSLRRYRRNLRAMDKLSDHFIVCGVGTTGIHVLRELRAVGHQVVAVDQCQPHLDAAATEGALPLHGDATDDAVLTQAGLSRARGIVTTLDDDKTNMFLVVTARQANPRLRIVSKAISQTAIPKLRRAGADAVVSPNFIGGMRLASELVRPQVVHFLDTMLRGDQQALRIEEVSVEPGSPIAGQTLAQADLRRRTGTLVIAVQFPDGQVAHAPPAEHRIEPGQTLILIGETSQVAALRALAEAPHTRRAPA